MHKHFLDGRLFDQYIFDVMPFQFFVQFVQILLVQEIQMRSVPDHPDALCLCLGQVFHGVCHDQFAFFHNSEPVAIVLHFR